MAAYTIQDLPEACMINLDDMILVDSGGGEYKKLEIRQLLYGVGSTCNSCGAPVAHGKKCSYCGRKK